MQEMKFTLILTLLSLLWNSVFCKIPCVPKADKEIGISSFGLIKQQAFFFTKKKATPYFKKESKVIRQTTYSQHVSQPDASCRYVFLAQAIDTGSLAGDQYFRHQCNGVAYGLIAKMLFPVHYHW